MKPVKITKQDQFGYERTFVIRRDETCGKMFLAEIDPDFGFESYTAPWMRHSTASAN